MTVKYSQGLLAYIGVTGSKKAALDGGFLAYYSGTVPASANDAIDSGSSVLAKFTESDDGSTGLTFESSATDGVLKKNSSETWKSTVGTAGTATFFRFYDSSDDGSSASTTAKRIQGTLGTTAASDAQLATTTLAKDAVLTVDIFQDY